MRSFSILSKSPSTQRRILGRMRLLTCAQDREGEAISVCIAIKAGSRFEDGKKEVGAAHFLQHLAFPNDGLFRTETSRTRELLIHKIDFPKCELNKVLSSLASSWNGSISSQQLERARTAVQVDLDEADPVLHVSDMLHAGAFSNGLDHPLYCTPDKVANMQLDDVNGFKSKRFTGSQTVITAVGLKEDDFLESCNTTGLKDVIEKSNSTPNAIIQGTTPIQSISSTPSHYAIAFPAPSVNSPDFLASCLWQMILGGGGSFSSGGPGKGLLARIYTNVLCKYPSVSLANCYSDHHSDAGLMGVVGSAPPSDAEALMNTLLFEFTSILRGEVVEAELSRAKSRLISTLIIALESRMVSAEDMARQLLLSGHIKSVEETVAGINAITMNDMKDMVNKCVRHNGIVAIK